EERSPGEEGRSRGDREPRPQRGGDELGARGDRKGSKEADAIRRGVIDARAERAARSARGADSVAAHALAEDEDDRGRVLVDARRRGDGGALAAREAPRGAEDAHGV